MSKASEALLALELLTFRHKKELGSNSIPQFGTVVEQASQVRHVAVNAMLLN